MCYNGTGTEAFSVSHYPAGATELMELIRVLLADDHVMVREGTREILEREPDLCVVAEAGDGRETIALVEREQPDVAVVDISMPVMNASGNMNSGSNCNDSAISCSLG